METPQEVKARIAAGFGRAAPTYDTVIPFFRTFAHDLIHAAALRPAERVLDLACGRGACLQAAAERVGAAGYVLGVDLSSAMIDMARTDLVALDLPPTSVEVSVADAEHLEVPDGSFDVAVCGFGVFFFPDPAAALAEVLRVLRAGGRFAASTFASSGGYPWVRDVMRDIQPRRPTPPASPVATGVGLVEVLQETGFIDARTTRVEQRFMFPTVDDYLAWNWSHGMRSLLESLTDQEVKAFRVASATRLQDHTVDGGFELVQVADMTVAVKPATAD